VLATQPYVMTITGTEVGKVKKELDTFSTKMASDASTLRRDLNARGLQINSMQRSTLKQEIINRELQIKAETNPNSIRILQDRLEQAKEELAAIEDERKVLREDR
jgi:hypothetical protein